MQQQFDFMSANIRSRMTLDEAERQIRKYNILVPCPSRQTLIRMCEEGIFETPKRRDGERWLIFADSFWEWAKGDEALAA